MSVKRHALYVKKLLEEIKDIPLNDLLKKRVRLLFSFAVSCCQLIYTGDGSV